MRQEMDPSKSQAPDLPDSKLPTRTEPEKLGHDFDLLWAAHAISQFGVAFSAGAVAVIAVEVLGASAFLLAVSFGVARLVAAVCSVPVGLAVERRPKRSTLIATDLLRAASTIAVPVLLWNGLLSMPLLAVALAVDVFLSIASTSASGAHIKDLLPERLWSRGFARLETTSWVLMALFTPLGGLAVTLLGPTVTLSIDGLTYIVSAGVLTRITAPERPPAAIATDGIRSFARAATDGWRYIWGNGALRALFQNALLFGGSLVMIQPLLAVLVLRDLELEPWHYAIVLGVPGVGGAVGAAMAPRIERAISTRQVLLVVGTARTVWTAWIALSPAGTIGFLLVLVAETLLMFSAGAFNPVFAAYQASITSRDHMARVSAAWGASAMVAQPMFMIAGGIAAGIVGLRPTIAAGGLLLLASSILLPWRQFHTAPSQADRIQHAS